MLTYVLLLLIGMSFGILMQAICKKLFELFYNASDLRFFKKAYAEEVRRNSTLEKENDTLRRMYQDEIRKTENIDV